MPPSVVRRGIAVAIASATLALGLGTAAAPEAVASPTVIRARMEAAFLTDVNAARAAVGLRPYVVAADLVAVARRHSAQMASRQLLFHNPGLTTDIANWRAVGENVGEGPTEDSIHTAFMHSAPHRANIRDHDFTQIGIGVTVDSNGIVWVTEDFRQPM